MPLSRLCKWKAKNKSRKRKPIERVKRETQNCFHEKNLLCWRQMFFGRIDFQVSSNRFVISLDDQPALKKRNVLRISITTVLKSFPHFIEYLVDMARVFVQFDAKAVNKISLNFPINFGKKMFFQGKIDTFDNDFNLFHALYSHEQTNKHQFEI